MVVKNYLIISGITLLDYKMWIIEAIKSQHSNLIKEYENKSYNGSIKYVSSIQLKKRNLKLNLAIGIDFPANHDF